MTKFSANEENIKKCTNEKVKEILDSLKIEQWLWKENKYSYTIVSLNKELSFSGCFFTWEVWNKNKNRAYKYVINKWTTLPSWLELDSAPLLMEDYIKDIEENKILDYSKFEASMWINIENGKHLKVNLISQLYTMVLGAAWSWKSVFLKNVFLQILKNPYTEIYVIDKIDFQALNNTKKCIYRWNFDEITWEVFLSFLNYLYLEAARRTAYYKTLWVANWQGYKRVVKENPDKEYENLNYIYVLIDEYQTLRNKIASIIWEATFDNAIKQLLDVARSSWMCFYFWSQDALKSKLWQARSSATTFFYWKMDYADGLSTQEMKIVKSDIPWTYLFYSQKSNQLLKIPFTEDPDKLLVDASNDPANRLKENKIYDNIPELVNDILWKIKSDIFASVEKENIFKFFNISDKYIEKLRKSTEYIAFSILIYQLYRLYTLNLINGRLTDLFTTPKFTNSNDTFLFENLKLYQWNKKFIAQIENTFELAQDGEVFIEAISNVLDVYLRTILWATAFWKEENEEAKLEEWEVKWNNENNNEDIKIKEKDDPNILITSSYRWTITPQSFNSMYHPDKNWEKKISQEAKKYKELIKQNIVNKMLQQEKKQTKMPVIVDLEFTLGLPVKKDWNLSRIGRNDLDNLFKATLDWIQGSIINNDSQIYCIRAKINYIEKQNSYTKNNKIDIKVLPLNKDTFTKYINKLSTENTATSPRMYFPIPKSLWITIPSVNSMYFYNEQTRKFSLSANALKYKAYLWKYVQAKYPGTYRRHTNDLGIYIDFAIWNSEVADLDNMLKATIDSFNNILYEDDNLVKEIICVKRKLLNTEEYNWQIHIQTFDYDLVNDIIDDKEDEIEEENNLDFMNIEIKEDKNDNFFNNKNNNVLNNTIIPAVWAWIIANNTLLETNASVEEEPQNNNLTEDKNILIDNNNNYEQKENLAWYSNLNSISSSSEKMSWLYWEEMNKRESEEKIYKSEINSFWEDWESKISLQKEEKILIEDNLTLPIEEKNTNIIEDDFYDNKEIEKRKSHIYENWIEPSLLNEEDIKNNQIKEIKKSFNNIIENEENIEEEETEVEVIDLDNLWSFNFEDEEENEEDDFFKIDEDDNEEDNFINISDIYNKK